MSKKKSSLITWLVIIGVVAISTAIIISRNLSSGSGVSPQLAQCIGSHSQVYVQLGCSHCTEQESIFGDSWKYMNSTDCYYNPQQCISQNISGTPTWIVNGTPYLGTQSVDKLKELTGC